MKSFISSFLIISALVIFSCNKNNDLCETTICQFDNCVNGECECTTNDWSYARLSVICTPCSSSGFTPKVGIMIDGANVGSVTFNSTITSASTGGIRINGSGQKQYYIFLGNDTTDGILSQGTAEFFTCKETTVNYEE